MTYEAYSADCLGMLVRQLYHNFELPLYTEMVSLVKKPVETAESVKAKILNLLNAEGREQNEPV